MDVGFSKHCQTEEYMYLIRHVINVHSHSPMPIVKDIIFNLQGIMSFLRTHCSTLLANICLCHHRINITQ